MASTKDVEIHIRVAADEKARLSRMARAVHKPLSAFVRDVLAQSQPTDYDRHILQTIRDLVR